MSIELSQVYILKKRPTAVAVVGRLAREGVEYLGSPTDEVLVIGERITHFYARNRDLTELEIITMSYGIWNGLILADREMPNCLLVGYKHPDNDTRYKLALKYVRQKGEIWVSTMHRTQPRQTKAMLRRGIILKNHS